jgi:hypothetical protein
MVSPIPSGYVKVAIDNSTFIVDVPIKDGDFPWYMLVYQIIILTINIHQPHHNLTLNSPGLFFKDVGFP